MKKLSKILFLFVIAVALTLSFAACIGPVNPASPTVERIQIATSGKTEFTLGDNFSVGNLAVEEVKSDGTKTTLTASEYTVDSSAYDKSKVGTYNIIIKLNADITKTANYDVNVNPAPLTNYLESLQSSIEDLAEADIPVVTFVMDFGVDKREMSLTLQDEKFLYIGIDESLGVIQKNIITCVGGTVYVKVEAFGKEQLQKKSGTADDVLSELAYDESQLNPAYMAQMLAELLEHNNITSGDFEYSVKDFKHVLETEVDFGGGDKADFTFKIDSDGRLVSIEWEDDISYFAVIYDYSAGAAITAPTGTYTEVAAETSAADMADHNLAPDAFANSAAAYNAIFASIDKTAAINNICITYNLEGYSEDLGGDIEQSLVLNKSNGNTKLISEIVMRVQGSRIMEIYQEVTFIDGTLYVYNYMWMTGLGEMVDEGEYITGVTEAEFKPLFESYYATFGGMLESSFLKEMFQEAADLQYEDEVSSGDHMITAQEDDGLLTVIITDSKYLREIIIEAEDGTYMSYHYNYWSEVNVPDEELIEYSTDVTGQKTAAELFAGLTA